MKTYFQGHSQISFKDIHSGIENDNDKATS